LGSAAPRPLRVVSTYTKDPTAPTPRCSVTCTEAGCANDSNGIEPFDKCPKHYARYQAYVARRDWVADLIRGRMDVKSVAYDALHLLDQHGIELFDSGDVDPRAFLEVMDVFDPDGEFGRRDQIAGAVMDVLLAGSSHAGDSRVAPPAAAHALQNTGRRLVRNPKVSAKEL